MKFDVDRAIAERRRRRETEARDAAVRAVVDVELEARLLTAMICDDPFPEHAPGCCDGRFDGVNAIARCEDVELDDFTDFRYRAIFRAFRNLRARGAVLEAHEWTGAIADEINRTDVHNEQHVRDTVDFLFLTELVLSQKQLGCNGLEHAKTRLRDLANHRRLA